MFTVISTRKNPVFKEFLTISLLISFLLTNMYAAEKPGINNLRTEYKVNPIGIGTVLPRLSWELMSNTRSFVQKSYHIQAALSEKDLISGKNLAWDSGEINSGQSSQVEYKGTGLKSGERVYWHIKIKGNDGSTSEWSKPAYWEMGMLNASDWKAKWIEPNLAEDSNTDNPCPYLRKNFEINKAVKSARAYVTSHGLYEFHLNGEKVSDQYFTPGWTSYNKRLQYQVYDVAKYLVKGENAAGAVLGDGWYKGPLTWDYKRNSYGNKPGLLLQIEIVYEDGSKEFVLSDNSWKVSTGPILSSEIYDGEAYDARLEKEGWDKAGYDDKSWAGVTEKDYNNNNLISSEGEAVRITDTIKPIKKLTTPKGELVFDMGQNMVGWVKLALKGKPGETITIHHAEVLDKDGNFYTANLRRAKQEIKYTFKGTGTEIFEPHFTFMGFRYISISGYTGDISADNISGQVVHSDMTPSGSFECSDTLLNQLQKNIQWGLRGNFVDVPTDCPQRDERLGWTGDAQTFAPTACFNMDAAAFYTKWMKDFIADQYEDGRIPHVIPDILGNGNGGAAGWADCAVIVPWVVYQNYGDKRMLEIQYESMKKWVGYLKNNFGKNFIWDQNVGFGDWLAYAPSDADYPGATTDKDLIGTAYFYYSTTILIKTADILGKADDAKMFRALAENIKAAFQKEFVTQTGRLTSGTQTAYVLALDFGLLPDNMVPVVAQRLADDVDGFGNITTGFLGASRVCQTLTNYGYNDLAFMLLFRKDYPGWLYPVLHGATTIWERWDGLKPDGTFQDKGMNSFNHYAYGAVGKWMYSRIAGIDLDPANPGYKKVIMKPLVPKELTYAKADYHSIYGDIKAEWKNDNTKFTYEIQVPANTTAEITLPFEGESKITESGKKLNEVKDLKVISSANGNTVITAGSGTYRFEVNK